MYQLRGQWVAQVGAGRAVSGRRRYLRATRRTKAEALAELPALRRRAAATTPEGRNRTVAVYLREWVRDVAPDTVGTEIDLGPDEFDPGAGDAYAGPDPARDLGPDEADKGAP